MSGGLWFSLLLKETEEMHVLCFGCESQCVQPPTFRLSLATSGCIVLIFLTRRHPSTHLKTKILKNRETKMSLESDAGILLNP